MIVLKPQNPTVIEIELTNSADSGPEKPENPNLETETRQTRTRKIVKIPKPDKPEPENETRGYPMYFYRQKNGKNKAL